MPELTLERSEPSRSDHNSGPADESAIDGLDRVGVALADPIRRRVLVHLLDGPQFPSDLARTIGTSRSNLSNHLSCLRGCGLIMAERAGRNLSYQLVSEEFTVALRSLLVVAATLPDCDDNQPINFSGPAK